MLRVVLVAFTALLAALGIAACGGGGGSSDDDQITAVIDRAFTQNDPASCDEIVTDLFIKSFYGGSVASCKKNAADTRNSAESVRTTNIQIDGERATSDVELVGGPVDGQKIAVSLAKEGDQWKIDSLRPADSGTATGTGATTGTGTTGATSTSASDPVELFYSVIRSQLKANGTPDVTANCIVDKLRASLTPQELAQLNAGKDPSALGPKVSGIARKCGQQALSGD